ncbi:MAG: NAD(P)/FAD-dependent oxidoreductase [Vicinamibacterales bacterium]
MSPDVIVVGAGPAGSICALVLARAGVRVRIVDRASFPRDKLCGDSVNPGTLAALARLGVSNEIEGRGLPIAGMRITGPGGVAIDARYPGGLRGVTITRCELDQILLSHAVGAGASLETGRTVRAPLLTDRAGAPVVEGVEVDAAGLREKWKARVVVAADGRRSTLAFALKLTMHPPRPKRWAIGAYVDAPSLANPAMGEMHIRHGRYLGVAPLPGGRTNVCLVMPSSGGGCDFGDPPALLRREIEAEPMLRDRFASSRMVRPPVMLGPLAIAPTGRTVDGLLLAGDAAGFIDPMTGDGLRFAVQGGELAAQAAIDALEHGWTGVHARFADNCRREFAGKRRFNRTLRTLVSSPAALRLASAGARVAPFVLKAMVAYAGDCSRR